MLRTFKPIKGKRQHQERVENETPRKRQKTKATPENELHTFTQRPLPQVAVVPRAILPMQVEERAHAFQINQSPLGDNNSSSVSSDEMRSDEEGFEVDLDHNGDLTYFSDDDLRGAFKNMELGTQSDETITELATTGSSRTASRASSLASSRCQSVVTVADPELIRFTSMTAAPLPTRSAPVPRTSDSPFIFFHNSLAQAGSSNHTTTTTTTTTVTNLSSIPEAVIEPSP